MISVEFISSSDRNVHLHKFLINVFLINVFVTAWQLENPVASVFRSFVG